MPRRRNWQKFSDALKQAEEEGLKKRHYGIVKLFQCLKHLIPENTIAIPYSLALAITRSSLIDPPGSIIALIPASFATSIESGNGKKASLAITDPGTFFPPLCLAIMVESTLDICPAPIPVVTITPFSNFFAKIIAFDLVCLQTLKANIIS